jgi:hypothetical protein
MQAQRSPAEYAEVQMPEAVDLPAFRQAVIDEEHLKLLSLGYMISAGFNALFACFGLFYALIGAVLGSSFAHVSRTGADANQLPPAFIGWIFAGIGMVLIAVSLTFAILKFCTASSLKRRTSRVFCMVVAGITCLEFPYGTGLGVLTFMALGRESVVRLFAHPGTASQPVQPAV